MWSAYSPKQQEKSIRASVFLSMHGATRFIAEDFDQDGDMDFGIIGTFSDYENTPGYSFVS